MTPYGMPSHFLPAADEIESNPGQWARISRDDAFQAMRFAQVAVVYRNAGLKATRWLADFGPSFVALAYLGNNPAFYVLTERGMSAAGVGASQKPRGGRKPREDGARAEESVLEPLIPDPEYWVDIEMVDEEGRPARGILYHAELPDGSVRKGFLNAAGRARIESHSMGSVKVHFPDLDESSYHLE